MSNINIQTVRIDGGTQSRVKLDEATIADYAQVLSDGVELPPVVVFFDGTDSWLADGFHRLHAYRENRRTSIPADVRDGTLRDALLHSFGANSGHGLRRTNEDKHKIVGAMLDDAEWSAWSNYSIAKTALVSEALVRSLRLKRSEKDEPPTGLAPDKSPAERAYTNKHGTKATMKTGAIGKKTPLESDIELPPQRPLAVKRQPETKAVDAAVEQGVSDTSGQLTEALDAISAMADEIEELKANAAVENMDATEEGKTEAAELLASQRAQILTLTRELDATKSQRDLYMTECDELKKQVAWLTRKLKKLEQAA